MCRTPLSDIGRGSSPSSSESRSQLSRRSLTAWGLNRCGDVRRCWGRRRGCGSEGMHVGGAAFLWPSLDLVACCSHLRRHVSRACQPATWSTCRDRKCLAYELSRARSACGSSSLDMGGVEPEHDVATSVSSIGEVHTLASEAMSSHFWMSCNTRASVRDVLVKGEIDETYVRDENVAGGSRPGRKALLSH